MLFVCVSSVLAVSGGSDSMALCLLTHQWLKNEKKINPARKTNIIPLFVDHQLPSDDPDAAQNTKEALAEHGTIISIITPPSSHVLVLSFVE